MEKKISITTDIRKFYKQYLNILKPMLDPYLPNSELNVLAELMYVNYKYNDYDKAIKDKMMFDYDTKISIIDSLDISIGTLNNNIMDLRKKGYIKGNAINQNYIIIPGKEFKLNFNFTLEDEG